MKGSNSSIEAIRQEIAEEHALLRAHLHTLIIDCTKLQATDPGCLCATEITAHCFDRALQHVGELLAYIVNHFRHEEVVMRQFDLPVSNPAMFEEHTREHAELSEGFSRLASEIDDKNPLPQLKQLHALMDSWLHQHILVHDKQLLAELGARPLSA